MSQSTVIAEKKPPMLKVEQVADRINVSASMIYALVDKGLLDCNRIGRCVRFTELHIESYLASNANKNKPRTPRRQLKHLDM